MWKWLYAIAENAFLKERIASLEDELADTKRRLYAEIDGNRLREDALVKQALSTTTPTTASLPNIPSRPNFNIRPEGPTQEEMDVEEPTIRFSGVDERWVQQRADEFIEAAARYGNSYEDREALCDEIRNNPDKYLIN